MVQEKEKDKAPDAPPGAPERTPVREPDQGKIPMGDPKPSKKKKKLKR